MFGPIDKVRSWVCDIFLRQFAFVTADWITCITSRRQRLGKAESENFRLT